MKSRYPSKCKECGASISVGDLIHKKGSIWVCNSCGTYRKTSSAPKQPSGPFVPTLEQQVAIDLFDTGGDLAIQAGAGAGKTSTLVALANQAGILSKGQYVAFNKAIVRDAAEKMPDSVKARTAHSIAYAACGWRFKDRLENGARMRSADIAKILGVKTLRVGEHWVAADVLAGIVSEALSSFCQSADPAPEAGHFPYLEGVDPLDQDGNRTSVHNDLLRAELLPFLVKAWESVQNPLDSTLPFDHAYYLKLAQLEGVKLDVDFVLFDECQDASPVLLDIVRQQGCQLVFVGDPNQAIYEWAGAVDAFGKLDPSTQRTSLTQSFRFGDAIAWEANAILARLDGFKLVGNPKIASRVERIPAPEAILARTNAGAVAELIRETDNGRRGHLVGGGEDMLAFLKSVDMLKAGDKATHRDLACFSNWGEVQEYVDQDRKGRELKCLVDLVDRFSTAGIRRVIMNAPPEANADVVVSTAHKAKGREWTSVRLASDFASCLDEDATPADLRLYYVAVTRARTALDNVDVVTTAAARASIERQGLVGNAA
jgi:hypothetical protein